MSYYNSIKNKRKNKRNKEKGANNKLREKGTP